MELRDVLTAALDAERDHTRRLVMVAAVVSEALRQEGLMAVVVGGSAIEIHAPGAYTTSDIDLVVPEHFGIDWETAVERAFSSLGFRRIHRHWVRDDIFVEIPSRTLSDPTVIFHLGGFELQVIAKEVVLADRVVGFKYWGVTDYGLQAIAMLHAFAEELDEELLDRLVARENAADALAALRRLAQREETITDARLRQEQERLKG